MLTLTTAPTRPKHNKVSVIRVGPFVLTNIMTIDLQVQDENNNVVAVLSLFSTPQQRTGIAYDSQGGLVVTDPVSSTGGFLTADFNAWSDHPSGTVVSVRHAALETRLQSTGRIPA